MTASEQLRTLVKAARRDEENMVLVNSEDLGYVQYSHALTWLEDNALELAELVADMGEALWAIQTHTRFSEMADGEKRIMQVAGVLARLDALFSEEVVT